MPIGLLRAAAIALLAVSLILAGACTGGGPKYPAYSPHENILSIAAEFELLGALDPYRDPVAVDLTGQNLARATLIRLANYETLHPERFTPEIAMLRGRAMEWLLDLRGAEKSYALCAEFDTELKPEALRRTGILRTFLSIETMDPRLSGDREAERRWREGVSAAYATEVGALEDPFYRGLALRLQECSDVLNAETVGTPAAFEAVLSRHGKSARGTEHALRLARAHAALAQEEVRLAPLGSAWFDAEEFRTHFQRATELLYRVAQEDGAPEKPIAQAELEALLATAAMVEARGG